LPVVASLRPTNRSSGIARCGLLPYRKAHHARNPLISALEGEKMKKTISSIFTFFYKFIFTTVWIGGFTIGTFRCFINNNESKWIFFSFWILGSLWLWWGAGRLKYVAIENDHLIISNYLKKISVPFSNIERVTQSSFINIYPIWIHFRKPTDFGKTIMFMPKVYWNKPRSTVEELRDLAGINK